MKITTQTLVKFKPQSYGVGTYNTWRAQQAQGIKHVPTYPYVLQQIDREGFAVLPMGMFMAMFGNMMCVHRERPIDESSIEIME